MEYYFLLSLHLFAIFIWMSSFFYLYRLQSIQAKQNNQVFFDEAIFIYKKVASPALTTVVVLGIALISLNKGLLETGLWIYIKFFLISLMAIMHFQYKIDINAIKKDLKVQKKEVIVYHIYSLFVMLAFVIVLTITKPF
jgi:putative membrane protein